VSSLFLSLLGHFSLYFVLIWQPSPVQTTAVLYAASNRSTRGPEQKCASRLCLNLTRVQICLFVCLFVKVNSIFWTKSPFCLTKLTIWHIKNSNAN
jgi:hypothetical protein